MLISVALFFQQQFRFFEVIIALHVFAMESWQSPVRHRGVSVKVTLKSLEPPKAKGFLRFLRAILVKLQAAKVTADLPRTKIPGVSAFTAGSEWQDMSVRHLCTECSHNLLCSVKAMFICFCTVDFI